MQGIEQVVSKMNLSPEQASSITVCSNDDVHSAEKSSNSGSILLQSSSEYIIQPSPEHHTKIPTSNHGTVLVLSILVLICNHHKVYTFLISRLLKQSSEYFMEDKPSSIAISLLLLYITQIINI